MPAPLALPNLDDLISRYYAGESLEQLSREAGISTTGLRGVFGRAGVRLRNAGERIYYGLRGPRNSFPNIGEVVARYEGGESVNALSKSLGSTRDLVISNLVAAGVNIRGQSEAEALKWAAMKGDRAAVVRQCSGAWDAMRGRSCSLKELMARARGRQLSLAHVGPYETEVVEALRAAGVEAVQQRALGVRNLDVAIPASRIAVEVVGSRWRPPSYTRAKVNQRTKEVVDEGWCVAYVFAWSKSLAYTGRKNGRPVQIRPFIDFGRVAKQLVAFAEVCSADEAAGGQYGVMDGYGQPLPAPRGYLDDFTRVPGF